MKAARKSRSRTEQADLAQDPVTPMADHCRSGNLVEDPRSTEMDVRIAFERCAIIDDAYVDRMEIAMIYDREKYVARGY